MAQQDGCCSARQLQAEQLDSWVVGLVSGSTSPGLQPLGQEEDEEDDDPDQVENLSVHFTLLCRGRCVVPRSLRLFTFAGRARPAASVPGD